MVIGFYLYKGIEILDFAGPYSVFSAANRKMPGHDFGMILFSKNGASITTQNGITLDVNCDFNHAPVFDILVIPGGQGSRDEYRDAAVIDSIQKISAACKYILCVCTGALILAKTGLLRNKLITSHRAVKDMLYSIDPSVTFVDNEYFVQNENIITTAGVLTGIRGALRLVSEIYGDSMANEIARDLYVS
jgi:transcriptional regulator GlxA family with amidase domain